MSFSDLKRLFDESTLRRLYRSSERYKWYCGNIPPEEEDPPPIATTGKEEEEEEGNYQRQKCSEVADRKHREKCREEKVVRCLKRRRTSAQSPLEHPCTSQERRDRRRHRRLMKMAAATPSPWSRTRNCSSLRLKSDRRVCRREKRRRCRRRMAAEHSHLSGEKLAALCVARRWIGRCAKRGAKRGARQDAAGAYGAAGAIGPAGKKKNSERDCKRQLRKWLKRLRRKNKRKKDSNRAPGKRIEKHLRALDPEDVKYL